MDCDDTFGHSRHSYDIGADAAKEAVFRSRFKIRPRNSYKNAFLKLDFRFERDLLCKRNQLLAVRLRHIRESRTKLIIVGTDQWIITEQINVCLLYTSPSPRD